MSGPAAPPEPLTSPPPSAPGEFLTAQWIPSRRASLLRDGTRPTITPPPPSAPREFLEAQWQEDPEAGPEETESRPDIFADAVPVALLTGEELDRLNPEIPAPYDFAPQPDEEQGTAPGADRMRIRGVPLEIGETLARVFLPNEGLAEQVPPSGQALILTSRRLIAFRGVEGYRDTHIALTSEISQCSVRTGQRNWGAILQGLMIMVGGAVLYLVVGYWLAGQISGPNVPVLNIDVAPLIALIIILAGLLVLLQNYLTRPAGALIFHGEGLEIAFPFRSSLDVGQVYDFVDLAHSIRRNAGLKEVRPEE